MHSPLFLREQLKTAIAAGDLTDVAAMVDECKQAGVRRFAAVFAPDDSDDGSSLPLFEAVRTGQGAIVGLLLEQGCDLEQRDKIGATPLHQAYSARQVSIAAQLIAAGADIRATTKLGTRVLDTVLASGNMEQVDWFVRQGVALASVNEKGNTALHFACRSGNIELAMRIHERCGVAFDRAARDGRRPLDACSSYALFAAILQRYPAIALDIGFEDGSCSLHGFARRGCTDIVCHLLDAGCDADQLVAYKNTLMHSAVASHKADLVQELLRRKLKVEGRNTLNYRPLHWAAQQGDLDIVKLLVEQGGAKVNIKGNLNFIIRETKTPLYMAINEGYPDVARYLVERGADLNALNDQANRTAAYAAAGQGDSALLRYLLERGASPNGVNRDPDCARGDFSSFPLANAANAEVVDVLVEFGVDLNARNSSFMRPESALRCLVGRIEKKDLESERGRGRLGAIEALLRHGASLSDGLGQIVDDARCVEVARLLRAAERRQLAPPPASAQVEAGDAHRAFIMDMANLMSDGRHQECMLEMETERYRTGLGITLFEQALRCSEVDHLEMFLETLRDADSGDVNYASADSYHDDETILHRVLDSFRCYEPDGEGAPIAMLRECVKLLLDKGANPDAVETLYHETPYHKVAKMACSAFGRGHVRDDLAVLDILEDFSAAGADPNLPNEEGANVIDLLRHPALVSWMRAHQGCHGEYPAALFDAVSACQPDLLAALIGDAGNWRGLNAHGCNLLGWWAMDATGEADWPNALRNLEILEGYGFVVNAAMEDGKTALFLACQQGALLQAEWLCSHYDWDLNAQDDGGCVPLAALVAASCPERYGDAMTPKEFRARRDALAVAMVRQGARLDLADQDGDTPLSRCTTVALRNQLEKAARAVEKAAQNA
ncbi:ankyrin repeat domain-containing protein [Massilia aquatica]|uniref:Ankyrin repeat domain-containing protein n=1 Tax=Massilia aquatica TaxID=2609000 RepID=A0ABX0MHG0_9BURK|nr:ankyrin repeat domain-containing protein [Massilia aquatica]NHZ44332.1 ankyrin repeat domain-containing protein [Massilia aquatica]